MYEYIVPSANACCVCVYVWDISTTGRGTEYIACMYY